MKIKLLPRKARPFATYQAKDYKDAYEKGYFSGAMRRDELMNRIAKYNTDLRWFANEKYRALWDTRKNDSGFICGIAHDMAIPPYTILRFDPKDERTLDTVNPNTGEKIGKETIYKGDDENKVIARGWKQTLYILKCRGYEIDDEGISGQF